MLTYLVLYKKTIVYDIKESIFKSKRFDVNIIIIFKKRNMNYVCYESV
jgi:hypothetical protein